MHFLKTKQYVHSKTTADTNSIESGIMCNCSNTIMSENNHECTMRRTYGDGEAQSV